MAPTPRKPVQRHEQSCDSSDSDISSVEDGDAYESPDNEEEDPDQEYNVDAIPYAYSFREPEKKSRGRKSQARVMREEAAKAKPQWHYGVIWKGYLKALSDSPQPVDSFEGPKPPVIVRFWAGMGMTPSDGSLEPLDKIGDRYFLPSHAMKQWLNEEPTRSWKLFKKRQELQRAHVERVSRGQATGMFRCPKRYSDHYHWLKFKKRSEQAMGMKTEGRRPFSSRILNRSSDESDLTEDDDAVPLKATQAPRRKAAGQGKPNIPNIKTDKPAASKRKSVVTSSTDSDSSVDTPLSSSRRIKVPRPSNSRSGSQAGVPKTGKPTEVKVEERDGATSEERVSETVEGQNDSAEKAPRAGSDKEGEKTGDAVDFGELDHGIFELPPLGVTESTATSAPITSERRSLSTAPTSAQAPPPASEYPTASDGTDKPPSSEKSIPPLGESAPTTVTAQASPSVNTSSSIPAAASTPAQVPVTAPNQPVAPAKTDKPPSSKGSVPLADNSVQSAVPSKDPPAVKSPTPASAQTSAQVPAPNPEQGIVTFGTDKPPSSKGSVPPPGKATPSTVPSEAPPTVHPPSSIPATASTSTQAPAPSPEQTAVPAATDKPSSSKGSVPPPGKAAQSTVPPKAPSSAKPPSSTSSNPPSSTSLAKPPAGAQKKVKESYDPRKVPRKDPKREALHASSAAQQTPAVAKDWLKTMKIAKRTQPVPEPASSTPPKPAQPSHAVLSTSDAVNHHSVHEPRREAATASGSTRPLSGPSPHAPAAALPEPSAAGPGIQPLRVDQPVRSSSISDALVGESPVTVGHSPGQTGERRAFHPGSIDLTTSHNIETSSLPSSTPAAILGPGGKERPKYEQPKRIKHIGNDDEIITPQEARKRRMTGEDGASPVSPKRSKTSYFPHTSKTTQRKKDTDFLASTTRLSVGRASEEQQRPGVAQRKTSDGTPAQMRRVGSTTSSLAGSMTPPPVPRGRASLDRSREGSGVTPTRDGTYSPPADRAGKPLNGVTRQGSADQPKPSIAIYQPRNKAQVPPQPPTTAVQSNAPNDPRLSISATQETSQSQSPAPLASGDNVQSQRQQQGTSHLGLTIVSSPSTIKPNYIPTPTSARPPAPVDSSPKALPTTSIPTPTTARLPSPLSKSPKLLLTLQRLRSDTKFPDGPELSDNGQAVPLASAANVDPFLCPVQSLNVIPENVVTLSPYLLLKHPKMWVRVMKALRGTRRWGAYLTPSVLCFLKQTWDDHDYDLSPDPTESFSALISSLPLDGGHAFHTGAPWGEAYGLSVSCNPPMKKLKRPLMEWRLWLTDVVRQNDFEALVKKCIGVEQGHFEQMVARDAGQALPAPDPVDREEVILEQLRDLTAMKTNDELVYTRYVYVGHFELGDANRKKVERNYSHGVSPHF
ncbi:hypothetical protein L198_01317 [Cryptococcus wingfieldii CBS 7118]|uniref:Uncharacterized protein n=1 Tax=Cryptococcus wingfieldii CBS 7118 TaxID=1295528 RepID=A0A1E3K0S0_9TREE|nr:hypothetical protein L198_01317 [Cryptococcus wingfieldii CBS 7118]ODO06087.1 hypothetical protein L198_01317 [Cryptococcus wingfieldii CBS 7118]